MGLVSGYPSRATPLLPPAQPRRQYSSALIIPGPGAGTWKPPPYLKAYRNDSTGQSYAVHPALPRLSCRTQYRLWPGLHLRSCLLLPETNLVCPLWPFMAFGDPSLGPVSILHFVFLSLSRVFSCGYIWLTIIWESTESRTDPFCCHFCSPCGLRHNSELPFMNSSSTTRKATD